MQVLPEFDAFRRVYDLGEAQILSTRLVADLETPVSAMLKLTRNTKYSFLLESVEGGAVRGRYSMIGMNPDMIWKVAGGDASINRKALHNTDGPFEPIRLAPLESLRALLAESRIPLSSDAPPLAAGSFGYVGYDMVRLMEDLPEPNPDTLSLPDGMMIRPTVMAIFDSVRDEVTVTSPVYVEKGVSPKAAYARAQERISEVIDALDRPLDHLTTQDIETPPIMAATSNTTPQEYAGMIAKAKDYITAGDIFQVVLSQRFEANFNLPPFALYRSLRRVNPSPFLYYLDFDQFAVIGSSPEILVRVRDGKVSIRPIAGTRRRGETPSEDRALAAELLADPKERAEHLMLLDLGRNDVGRVAEIGSIRVTD